MAILYDLREDMIQELHDSENDIAWAVYRRDEQLDRSLKIGMGIALARCAEDEDREYALRFHLSVAVESYTFYDAYFNEKVDDVRMLRRLLYGEETGPNEHIHNFDLEDCLLEFLGQ